jgi:hypothetical protein
MSKDIKSNSVSIENHDLSMRSLVIRCSVTANATPASKVHTTDLPGVVYLKTQGKDDVTAQESGAVTGTQTDASGQIGVLIKLPDAATEVTMLSVEDVAGNASGTLTVSRILTDGITAGGNIELQVAGLDTMASVSPTIAIRVDYKV